MGASEMFEPGLQAYLGYCAAFCFRYFAVAGAVYWLFHVAFRQRWLGYRIQQVFPAAGEVAYEIRWSLMNMACTGLSTLFLYWLIQSGRTRMYFEVGGGWLYLAFSAVLCVVAYDSWFYWQHRLLHTPWLFRHVHAVHHRAANPTAFASFAHHPIETFMGNAYFIAFVILIPVHPLALGAAGAGLFALNIVTHMGYELYPRGFTRHPILGWHNTSTHHNMHHRHVGWNYSICFNHWDRWMGTIHPAYDETFEAIKERRKAAAAAA